MSDPEDTNDKSVATRFAPGQSGNPAGRKPGAELVRQLLEPKKKELIEKAVEMALKGDTTALRICIDRLAPPIRAEAPTVHIPGLAAAPTLSAKAEAIVNAMGDGLISPDAVAMLLQAIAAACKVVEFDAIQRQLDEIKKELGGRA